MINKGNTRISDKTIAVDCLNSIKFIAETGMTNTLEYTTPQLRQANMQMNRDHQQLAEEVLDYMCDKGWCLEPRSDHQVVNQALSRYQNPAQTAFSYQQQTPPSGFQL